MIHADTPTSLSKLSRDSKETTPIANDAPVAERKTLVKENSQESDNSIENEKRPTSVVSFIFSVTLTALHLKFSIPNPTDTEERKRSSSAATIERCNPNATNNSKRQRNRRIGERIVSNS